MELSFAAKNAFFDRAKVQRAVKVGLRKGLSKAGAFVRRRARSSIRRRKAISAPGSPPSSHKRGDPNLRTILFAYEDVKKTVVVGPIRFNSPTVAPQLLEHGGQVTVSVVGKKSGKKTRKVLTYRPRPFMGPALAAEAPKFPDLFRGEVR